MYLRALIWCWREESNLRPTRYECVALPTELLQQKRGLLFQFRIETITVLASSLAPDETTSHSTDETPSHSTRSSKDGNQVAGYSCTKCAVFVALFSFLFEIGIRQYPTRNGIDVGADLSAIGHIGARKAGITARKRICSIPARICRRPYR